MCWAYFQSRLSQGKICPESPRASPYLYLFLQASRNQLATQVHRCPSDLWARQGVEHQAASVMRLTDQLVFFRLRV